MIGRLTNVTRLVIGLKLGSLERSGRMVATALRGHSNYKTQTADRALKVLLVL